MVLDVALYQFQPGTQAADAIEFDRRCSLGRHHCHVEPAATTGPGECLAVDVHRAPEDRLHRLAGIERGVEKDRIDQPPGCPDPSGVETGLLHGTSA
jgi:hypothetical protein